MRKAEHQTLSQRGPSIAEYLDRPHWRGSPLRSVWESVPTLLLVVALWYGGAALQIATGPLYLRAGFALAWSVLVLRGFILFHDCGHGSLFQGFKGASTVNWMSWHAFAAVCGTPVDWCVGHALHHANVGNTDQDDYDWAETIFHTSASYAKLGPGMRRVWKFFRHPIPFFILAPVATWYGRMRLPFEHRPGRKAAYRFSAKMISTALMVVRYWLASRIGIGAWTVFAGDYLAMFTGVVLFHWQHAYTSGYVTLKGEEWSRIEASLYGSSVLPVPWWFRWATCGIEYHHIHHFRTRIPGYMLRKCHEGAPPGMWDGVPFLSWADLYRSLLVQCYDIDSRQYKTFAEVDASLKAR